MTLKWNRNAVFIISASCYILYFRVLDISIFYGICVMLLKLLAVDFTQPLAVIVSLKFFAHTARSTDRFFGATFALLKTVVMYNSSFSSVFYSAQLSHLTQTLRTFEDRNRKRYWLRWSVDISVTQINTTMWTRYTWQCSVNCSAVIFRCWYGIPIFSQPQISIFPCCFTSPVLKNFLLIWRTLNVPENRLGMKLCHSRRRRVSVVWIRINSIVRWEPTSQRCTKHTHNNQYDNNLYI